MTRKALKGEVHDGMFPAEVLMRFRDAAGREVSFFAPIALVSRSAGAVGTVSVRVISAENGEYLVELPGDVYGAGRVVAVRESSLVSA
ncbi:MAG TPA: hypothetical protein PKD75_02675 [Tepidiformaceae bacterium]|nr:hypothetical protein [Tepidiformaceae bacterium]